jgi:hypothetical protein
MTGVDCGSEETWGGLPLTGLRATPSLLRGPVANQSRRREAGIAVHELNLRKASQANMSTVWAVVAANSRHALVGQQWPVADHQQQGSEMLAYGIA